MIPYWKHMIAVFLLTLLFVVFNNLSLWISVDFLKELFDPVSVEQAKAINKPVDKSNKILDLSGGGSEIYLQMKNEVKSWIIKETKQETLLSVCFFIFLTFLLKNITFYGKRILLNFVGLNIIVNIRNKLHSKMMHIPLFYFDNRHSGNLTSVMFNDVNAVKQVFDTTFDKMLLAPVQIIVNIIILFLISWELSLFTLIIIPISAFVTTKIGKSMRRRSRRVYQQVANVVAIFQEAITGIRIVKAFASESFEKKKFADSNNDYFKKTFRQYKLQYLTSPINETLYVTILVFLLWYGGTMVYSGEGIGAEDFIRFLLFLFMMFQPLKDISGVNNILQNGLAAAERIFEVLDEEQEYPKKPGTVQLQEFKSQISYRDVSFNYKADDKPVLQHINFEIKKGEMVAFVGSSGAGKTTLVNLLPRFYELTGGGIYLDGNDFRDFSLHSLRKHIGVVTQDTILFNETIRANIAYSQDGVSEQEIIAAAKAANAWEFIEKMPQGLDTEIGEKGTRLSGGQKQRLSIARAILKNPQILILDEATSALDTESEQLVQEAIEKLLKNRTVLVIAHRLSTIQNADKIVVIQNGVIESIGRHSELLQKSPVYKNLHQKQLLNTEEKKTDEAT